MGAVKKYLAIKEEEAAEMCKELIKSYNALIHNKEISDAVWRVTAKEIMSQAVNYFWTISTDGDSYIVEPDCLTETFEIDWADKSFRIDDATGGGCPGGL